MTVIKLEAMENRIENKCNNVRVKLKLLTKTVYKCYDQNILAVLKNKQIKKCIYSPQKSSCSNTGHSAIGQDEFNSTV